MLSAILDNINTKKIILGSNSEPRKNLLIDNLGLNFSIESSLFKENLEKSAFSSPEEYCLSTCKGKITEIMSRIHDFDILITCDTILVDSSDQIIEKPSSYDEQIFFLKKFSGHKIQAISALNVAIKLNGKLFIEEYIDKTVIYFTEIPEDAILNYGKFYPQTLFASGGIQVQNNGFSFVEKIEGDWSSIIGLPINPLIKILLKYYG